MGGGGDVTSLSQKQFVFSYASEVHDGWQNARRWQMRSGSNSNAALLLKLAAAVKLLKNRLYKVAAASSPRVCLSLPHDPLLPRFYQLCQTNGGLSTWLFILIRTTHLHRKLFLEKMPVKRLVSEGVFPFCVTASVNTKPHLHLSNNSTNKIFL